MQKIYLGDSYKLIKNIEDNSVDLVLIDPPYLHSLTKGSHKFLKKKCAHYEQIAYISKGFEFSILDEFIRVLKKINIYIFCSHKQLIPLLDYFVTQRGCNFTVLTWHKDNVMPACNNVYDPDTEFLLFFREKGVKLFGDFHTKRTYYVTHTNVKDKKLYGHPTPKPIHIIKNLIINSTNEGDLVLDTFSGSGTVAVACKELNRRCIAMEMVEEHYNNSLIRLGNSTVQNPNAEFIQQTLF